MKNKFKSFEVVKVNPKNGILDISDITDLTDLSALHEFGIVTQKDLIGKTGVVRAMIESERTGEWLYDVLIDVEDEDKLEFDEHLFGFHESDLESTGVMKNREDYYTDVRIRVRVDPETGEGFLVEDDEN